MKPLDIFCLAIVILMAFTFAVAAWFGRKPNISRLKDKKQMDRLIAALKYPDSTVRAHAMQALGELGEPQAVRAILEHLLSKKDIPTREQVEGLNILEMSEIASHFDDHTIELLTQLMAAPNDLVRYRVARLIAARTGGCLSQTTALRLLETLTRPELPTELRSQIIELMSTLKEFPAGAEVAAQITRLPQSEQEKLMGALHSAGWRPPAGDALTPRFWLAARQWDELARLGFDAGPVLRQFIVNHPAPGKPDFFQAASLYLRLNPMDGVWSLLDCYKNGYGWEHTTVIYHLLVDAGPESIKVLLMSMDSYEDTKLFVSEILWDIARRMPDQCERIDSFFTHERLVFTAYRALERYRKLKEMQPLVEQYLEMTQTDDPNALENAIRFAVQHHLDAILVQENLASLLDNDYSYKVKRHLPTMYGGDGREAEEEEIHVYPVAGAAREALISLVPHSPATQLAERKFTSV